MNIKTKIDRAPELTFHIKVNKYEALALDKLINNKNIPLTLEERNAITNIGYHLSNELYKFRYIL